MPCPTGPSDTALCPGAPGGGSAGFFWGATDLRTGPSLRGDTHLCPGAECLGQDGGQGQGVFSQGGLGVRRRLRRGDGAVGGGHQERLALQQLQDGAHVRSQAVLQPGGGERTGVGGRLKAQTDSKASLPRTFVCDTPVSTSIRLRKTVCGAFVHRKCQNRAPSLGHPSDGACSGQEGPSPASSQFFHPCFSRRGWGAWKKEEDTPSPKNSNGEGRKGPGMILLSLQGTI